MDRLTLSRLDEELDSSDVADLCFLCRDVVNRKRLETITDAKGLFMRLEEKGLLENEVFLSHLLQTIGRRDLLNNLRPSQYPSATETDASPVLSDYRKMLYRLYEDITTENLEKIKFLLEEKLGRRQTEMCKTALDVFAEMEKKDLLSDSNLEHLYFVLREVDLPLAEAIDMYRGRLQTPPMPLSHPQTNNQSTLPHIIQPSLSVSETQPSSATDVVFADSKLTQNSFSASIDETEYYLFTHNPRGLCLVINIEKFDNSFKIRAGTQEDARALRETFTLLGFNVEIHTDLSSAEIKELLIKVSRRDFHKDDALVVCVLSHGEYGCVFGTDGEKIAVRELTQPFTSLRTPSLAGKPKLFFIQACQGTNYQKGSLPSVLKPEDATEPTTLESDAGPVQGETIPSDADFLLGMSTVIGCKSFRSVTYGSIYIQELCKQINISAQKPELDDILSILTRVNRNVSKGDYLNYKQMPEPKYTLTKKVALRYM